MKNFISIKTIFLIFITTFTMLHAQEKNDHNTRVGIGVSIVDMNDILGFIISQGVGQSAAFCLTIDSSPGFRIEPEFGYSVYNIEVKDNGYTSESTLKILRLGTGLFAKNAKNNQYHIYYGIRLGYLYNSEESKYKYEYDSGTEEESSSGFYLSPTIGGEYFFSEYFSLGGETQFMYSTASFEDKDDPNEEVTISSTSVKAMISVRFYL